MIYNTRELLTLNLRMHSDQPHYYIFQNHEVADLLRSHMEANRQITELEGLRNNAIKALGDMQRQYSAAVGDFQTIQTALQNRIGELVRGNMRVSRELVEVHKLLDAVNLQEVGHALGLPLGTDVAARILFGIQDLKSRLVGAAALVALRDSQLTALRPTEPKFKNRQIVAWVGGHQTYRIVSMEFATRVNFGLQAKEWKYNFSTGGHGFESDLRALTEQEKG